MDTGLKLLPIEYPYLFILFLGRREKEIEGFVELEDWNKIIQVKLKFDYVALYLSNIILWNLVTSVTFSRSLKNICHWFHYYFSLFL